MLTERLAQRCDHVTATDVAVAALDAAQRRLMRAGQRNAVTLLRTSSTSPSLALAGEQIRPRGALRGMLYLDPGVLRAVMDREVPQLAAGATVLAAHWRQPVADYLMTGDQANDVIAATAGLHHLGGYRDADLAIDLCATGTPISVAARTAVPGAKPHLKTESPRAKSRYRLTRGLSATDPRRFNAVSGAQLGIGTGTGAPALISRPPSS